MGNRHTKGITDANLQSIRLADLHQCLRSPCHTVNRGFIEHGDSSDTHTDIDMDRYVCDGNCLFNKSHSTAYAVITYQTAYLKTYYAPEFMAALMTVEAGNTDKIISNIAECRDMGIEILPPDVNRIGMAQIGRIRSVIVDHEPLEMFSKREAHATLLGLIVIRHGFRRSRKQKK